MCTQIRLEELKKTSTQMLVGKKGKWIWEELGRVSICSKRIAYTLKEIVENVKYHTLKDCLSFYICSI